jgi:DNA-binding XRE family transcriptional regulator
MSKSDVRTRRKALGLVQRELAQLVGIRKETMSRIETGEDAVPVYLDMVLALVERDPEALAFALNRRGLPSNR